MVKRLKMGSLIPTGPVLLGALLINQPANGTSEKGETIGNATIGKMGRW